LKLEVSKGKFRNGTGRSKGETMKGLPARNGEGDAEWAAKKARFGQATGLFRVLTDNGQ